MLMKKTVKILLGVLFALLLVVFVYSAYQVTSTIHEYNEKDRYYERTRESAVTHVETPSSPGAKPETTDAPDSVRETSPISVDFETLEETCADIKGWLYSPDTKIDYPVVQSKDNSFYLHRLMDGSYNPSGTLFIDYRCLGDFSGRNTIIYGHHMNDGSMLASIVEYKNQAYYDAHPVMYLNTPDGDYRLDVVCGFVTWYDSRVYKYMFESRTEFEDWFALMRSYSDFTCDVEVGVDDRLVTLSTCTYEYDNARYVVMAKLVPLDSK